MPARLPFLADHRTDGPAAAGEPDAAPRFSAHPEPSRRVGLVLPASTAATTRSRRAIEYALASGPGTPANYSAHRCETAMSPRGPADDGRPAGMDTGIRLTTPDADAAHAALTAAGVDVDAEVLRWPGVPPMFVLRDPDGNRLTVVQDA